MATAGINGNRHSTDDITRYGEPTWQSNHRPLPHGVRYLGDGDWELPEGVSVRADGGDDWTLTMADGAHISVWTED